MSWAGKIKNALQGEVDGADALARLGAAAALAGLRQQLADRRLEVEIANVGEEWRIPDMLAPIAAPLWLAEGLVTVAQSLCDAEAADHPDRPSAMAPLTHGQVLSLLEPVTVIASDLSAMLADPGRRSTLILPILAAPYAPSGAGLMAERIPLPYLRGLLDGALSLSGAAQLVADDYARLVSGPSAPSWIAGGIAVLRGNMAAAQTSLDAAQGRAVSALRQQSSDEAALRMLAIDLWQLTNTYLKVGQLIAAPSLMPGAQLLPPRTQPVSPIAAAPVASPPQWSAPPAPPPPSPPAQPVAQAPLPPMQQSSAPPTSPAPAAPFVPPPPTPQPVAAPPAVPQAVSQPAAAPFADRPAPPPIPRQPQPMTQDGGFDRSAPPAPAGTSGPTQPPFQQASGGRKIERTDRWVLSSRPARHRLRGAGQEDQAERDLALFWEAKNWMLTPQEARYLNEVAALLSGGSVALSGRSNAQCPFAPIYRATRGAIQVLGRPLSPGSLFSYDYQAGGRGLLTDLPAQTGVADTA